MVWMSLYRGNGTILQWPNWARRPRETDHRHLRSLPMCSNGIINRAVVNVERLCHQADVVDDCDTSLRKRVSSQTNRAERAYTLDLNRALKKRRVRMVKVKGWKNIHKDKVSRKSVLRKSLEPHTLGKVPCFSSARRESGGSENSESSLEHAADNVIRVQCNFCSGTRRMRKNSIIMGMAVPMEKRRNEDVLPAKKRRERVESRKAERPNRTWRPLDE